MRYIDAGGSAVGDGVATMSSEKKRSAFPFNFQRITDIGSYR
jgi:hypothetical protein